VSDIIERLAGEIRHRPVLALAVTGLVGAVVVSRLRADDDDRLATLARHGQRGADALGGHLGDLADRGAGLARRGAEAVERGATLAERGAERFAHEAGRNAQAVGHAVGDGAKAGAVSAADRLDDFSLPDLLRELVGDRLRPSLTERVRRAAASAGITEKTASVFAATLLAKSVSGYLRWRGEQEARLQSQALASPSGEPFAERLEDHTVVELRQMAADRDVDGRSGMNKEELIEALGEQ